jgi:hypothetical protein
MNDAIAHTTAPRITPLVAQVDKLFPLLWLGLYLLLPVSGWSSEMFVSWADQRRDLEALTQLLMDGRAHAIADSVIGPAYIGAAALLREMFELSAEDALVVLTRGSYALSVAGGLLLVRVLVTRATHAPPIVSLASQLGFVALAFAAGTWWWSDVPWSHFFATCLAILFYVVRISPARASVATGVAAGALLALLATTRSFETFAVVFAWVITSLSFAALRFRPRGALGLGRVGPSIVAFVATMAVVHVATGKRDLFILYENNLDHQASVVEAAEIAETPTLSLALVPTKIVQLFFDPCYLSLCSISDYETGGGDGTNLDLWSLPLAVQLPMLLLLPLCLLAIGVLLVRAIPRRSARPELRSLTELTIAATCLVVGYAGSTLTGPSHLRYGFARDFILPAFLVAVVAVTLGAACLWRVLLRRRSGRPAAEVAFVGAALVFAFFAVGAAAVGRSSGLPRIEGRHLASVTYTARCARACTVSVAATGSGGQEISIPNSSTLTFGCGSAEPRFTIYRSSLTGVVSVPQCREPRLVAAWPTVMGLPPGSFELAAVRVRNA